MLYNDPTHHTLSVVRVERSTSETARRTSKGRKIGAWYICDAPKARPEGPSRCFGYFIRLRNDLYCVEWGVKLYSLFGYFSFVEERRSSGEARRAEPIFGGV